MTQARELARWPKQHDLFGVRVSATTYQECEDLIIEAAAERRSAVVTHLPVAGLMAAVRDRSLRRRINTFEVVAPDGQPVRWALNRFHNAALPDRVYGPEFMLRVCARAARQQIGIYLYGSTPDVVERLRRNLLERFPDLIIAGAESPPFRELTADERQAAIDRINASGAGLVFLGLGCPQQDVFAHETRDRIHAVQLCVGAAFDFHAGNKKMAPPWLQRRGLEWLFRLTQEPERLWRRYLLTNTLFLFLVARRMILGN